MNKMIVSTIAAMCMTTTLLAHEITVKMPLVPASSFDAKTNKVKGEVKKEGSKYTAENLWVKVEDLKTEIELRDKHFHEHLHYDKYPKITFTKVTAENGKGTGTLTVNGVSKEVPFTYKEAGPKKIEANMKVKPSDFKLEEAKYMGIGVADEVEVTVLMDV